jgi:tetratricopeptide (TPR) repeat protein
MSSTRLMILAVAAALLASACTGTEGRKARFLERGQEFMAEGNLEKARVEFSNALQIDPNDSRARYFAGRIAEKQGKPRDAVANYQAALEADPESLPVRGALGRIYLLGGLPDKAREIIEPGLAKAPDDAQLRTVRGGLRAMQGDLPGALEDAEVAVRVAPDDEVAIAFLAAQYSRAGRTDDALAALKTGIAKLPDSVDLPVIMAELLQEAGRKDEAVAQLQAVARAHPATLIHWQRLAHLQLLNQNPQGAEEALRQAVVATPDSIDSKMALVSLIGNQRNAAAGLAEMDKFVAADPKNAELKIAQGQLLESLGQADKAEAAYRSVIATEKLKPQGLVARNRLAALLVRRADLPAAEKLVAEVLAESARDNDALILRAGIAMTRGETSAAITDLRAVLRDQPTATPIMRSLARAHLQDGDAALAEEVLRGAVQTNPGDLDTRFDLAGLLTSSGRGNEALPVLAQLIKDAPDNVAAREAYFRVQAATSDLEGARKTASELKTLRPDLPVGAMLLGMLHEQQGKLPEATREYEYALGVSNDPSTALAALVRVDIERKQQARAIERIQTVISQAPKLATAHNLLGEVRLANHEIPAAVQAFDAAIAAQPAWWLPYRNKAYAQREARQPDQAAAALRDGIDKTGSLDLFSALAGLQESRGQNDAAIATYEEALQRYPRSQPMANNLAMMLVTYRAQDKASLERAAKVVEVLAGSDQPALLDTVGWVKYHNGALAEALPLLQQAAEKAPQSAAIKYHLGMAQLRNGDRAAARLSLQTALAGNVAFSGAEDARRTLAQLGGAG